MDASTHAAQEEWAAGRQRILDARIWMAPDGPHPRWLGEVFSKAIILFAWGMRLCGLYPRGRRNALAPVLEQFELSFPTLPEAFDGYRILQLTDTHLDLLPELGAIAGRMLGGVEIDLLVFTGDALADSDAPPQTATGPLAEAIAGVTVRGRRLAILGNHDTAAVAQALEALGFEMLLNRSTAIERDGDRIAVTGLDDVHHFYTPAAEQALASGEPGFRIALIHSPEMADRAGAAGVDFYLCGHTHGGQICLPGGRMLVTRLTRCRHAARGLWRAGRTVGYTSRGLGVSGRPQRFNCPGEITIITLRRG